MSHIGYKSAKDCVVTLEIPADALTNENRHNVINKQYGQFRTNRAKVLSVEQIVDGKQIDKICSDFNNTFIYKVGKIAEVKDYDTNIEHTSSTGIHYFLSKELAMTYLDKNLILLKIGSYHKLYDEQLLELNITGNNTGSRQGQYMIYVDGKIILEYNYERGVLHGNYTEFYGDGKIFSQRNYKHGKLQ